MQEKEVLTALQKMRDSSKQRKFEQTIELIINFRGIDFKKAENQIDVDVTLPHSIGKSQAKIAVFARDRDFAHQLKEKDVKVIMEDEISKIDKKKIEALASEYSFLAEGPVMLTVAKHFGQQLAPKGKMPKPIQPNIKSFDELAGKVGSSTKVTNKKGKFMPVVHLPIGKEKNNDKELAENVLAIYNTVVPTLSNKKQSIKSVLVKLTMGPPVKIGKQEGAEKK